MLRFIDHISADEYWFTGVFVTSQSGESQRPLSVSGTFLDNSGLLLFEGTFRFGPRNTSHPFDVQVLSVGRHQVAVRVRAGQLGALSGSIYPTLDGYDLLASSGSGNAASARIELTKSAGLRLTGAIRCHTTSIGFIAHGSPGADRAGLGNVVGVLGGRRA